MGHWIVVPVVLPALLAPFIVLAARFDIVVQRALSMAGTVALLAVAIGLWLGAGAGPEAYRLGDWPAPFGIVLVLDRLSALMLLLTALLAAAVLLHAIDGFDLRGRHFHALFQFQLMGLNGAFLTGDVFNLFVFFEVLLIASYGLMLHGAQEKALRAGLHYVAINLAGSTLFLFAVGLLYGVTGTLNMADLAVKVPLVADGDRPLIHIAGLLLFAVFAVKAALVPLHFWLPGTYAAAGPPVAALFAIMTKVGAYAILRVSTLVFGADAGGAETWLVAPWLIPFGLLTVAVGAIGVLGARRLRDLTCFAVIGSMGTLLATLGLATPQATLAALYYLISSTLAGASLFLVCDLLERGRAGSAADTITPAPPFHGQELVAGLFMLAAILMAGMPPLSGFLGKLLVLDAAASHPWRSSIWAVVLCASLLVIVGFGRAGSALFWKSTTLPAAAGPHRPAACGTAATATLIAASAALAAFARPADAVLAAIAAELHAPVAYIDAVLGPVPTMLGGLP